MQHSRQTPHNKREATTKPNLLFIEQARKAIRGTGAAEIDGILIGDAGLYELKLKINEESS